MVAVTIACGKATYCDVVTIIWIDCCVFVTTMRPLGMIASPTCANDFVLKEYVPRIAMIAAKKRFDEY